MNIGDKYIPMYHGDFEMELISINPIKIKCIKTDIDKSFKIGEIIEFKDKHIFELIWKLKK
jgi:hypothetical protein